MKILGPEAGTDLAAVLGGLVSSTASTLGFTSRSKSNPDMAGLFARGIMIASAVMFPRVLLEVLLVYPPLLTHVTVPIVTMLLVNIGVVGFLRRRARSQTQEQVQEIDIKNPLRLSSAITFALMFTIVLVAVKATQEMCGDVGVYVTSMVAGLTGVDSITLSSAGLVATGEMRPEVGATAVFLACVTNSVAKAAFSCIFGAPQLRRSIFLSFAPVILAGTVAAVVAL